MLLRAAARCFGDAMALNEPVSAFARLSSRRGNGRPQFGDPLRYAPVAITLDATQLGGVHASAAFGDVPLRLFARPARCCSFLGRRQLHAGATGLGQTDSDGLFGRARAMFSFADMFHFFPNEFASLR